MRQGPRRSSPGSPMVVREIVATGDAHDLDASNSLFPRSIERNPNADPDGDAYSYAGSHVLHGCPERDSDRHTGRDTGCDTHATLTLRKRLVATICTHEGLLSVPRCAQTLTGVNSNGLTTTITRWPPSDHPSDSDAIGHSRASASYAAFGFAPALLQAILLHRRPSSNSSVSQSTPSPYAQAHPSSQSLVQRRSSQSLSS